MPGRLTVVEQIYFQADDGQPMPSTSQHVHRTEDHEEPYVRTTEIGEDWTPLDRGWLGKTSCLILKNAPRTYSRLPNEDEVAAMNHAVLELAIKTGDTYTPISPIRYNRTMRYEPTDLTNLYIRCRKGKARCSVYIYPS